MDWSQRGSEGIIVTEPQPGVIQIRIDRPDTRNALTIEMFEVLHGLAMDIGRDDDARIVILTGTGPAFCSGFNLRQAEMLTEAGPLGMLRMQDRAADTMLAWRALRIPVIAAVNGDAAGGGLALALIADIRLAAAKARFSAAFVRVGLSAGDLGTSWTLTRLIGPGRAAELCFTGRFVDAAEAANIGLVNAVIEEEDDLLAAALRMADAIMANAPGGVQLSKRALQANMEAASFAAAIELENRGQALLTRTADMAEAIQAFREKRTARFVGN